MTEKKALVIGLVFLFLALLLGGISTYLGSIVEKSNQPITEQGEETSDQDIVAQDNNEEGAQEQPEERNVDPSELSQQASLALPIDVKDALKERILGNPNAPIKISEHSSFSCGHCGKFHNNVFKDFCHDRFDLLLRKLQFSRGSFRAGI